MPCKLCKKQPVWEFTNQQQLCKICFVKYFESKVKKTIRKYNMPINIINPVGKNNLKAKVINNILKKLPERDGKISEENLNDVSSNILYSMMYGDSEQLKKFFPKNQPLYFLSDEEILLYAKIKKIKGKIKEEKEISKDKPKEINNFVQKIEKKNPDIRHNVIMAFLRIERISNRAY